MQIGGAKRSVCLTLGLLLLGTPACAQLSTFSFHGTRLGDSLEVGGPAACPRARADSVATCISTDSLGTVLIARADTYRRGKLERLGITFMSGDFDAVVRELAKWYGPPAITMFPRVDDAFGGTRTNTVSIWPFARDTLKAVRYSNDDLYGAAMIFRRAP